MTARRALHGDAERRAFNPPGQRAFGACARTRQDDGGARAGTWNADVLSGQLPVSSPEGSSRTGAVIAGAQLGDVPVESPLVHDRATGPVKRHVAVRGPATPPDGLAKCSRLAADPCAAGDCPQCAGTDGVAGWCGGVAFSTAAHRWEREADRAATTVLGTAISRPISTPSRTPAGRAEHLDAALASEGLASTGAPLEPATRAFFEQGFGRSLRAVRLHADARATRAARSLNARAYTVGAHIAVRDGRVDQRDPGTRCLLAHELGHTIQQSGGGPLGLTRVQGMPVQRLDASGAAEALGPTADIRGALCDKIVPGTDRTRAEMLEVAHDEAYSWLRDALFEMSERDTGDPEEELTAQVRAAAGSYFGLPSFRHARQLGVYDEVLALWKDVFDVMGRMLDAKVQRYRCDCRGPLAITWPGLSHISVCRDFFGLPDDKQAATLIHEWAHRYGPPVVRRVSETYSTNKKYGALPREQLVQMPDAYMLFVWDLGGTTPATAF